MADESEMVERVARAIYEDATGLEPGDEKMRFNWVSHARAAIKAVREYETRHAQDELLKWHAALNKGAHD